MKVIMSGKNETRDSVSIGLAAEVDLFLQVMVDIGTLTTFPEFMLMIQLDLGNKESCDSARIRVGLLILRIGDADIWRSGETSGHCTCEEPDRFGVFGCHNGPRYRSL